ncbi:MAG: response regulator transcription factor [Bacillota bacterium]|nr:response regulator transcription factor [Bacillota bacterium]
MKKKILLVDDDQDIRDILRLYLENAGFEVLEAENGQEAYDLLGKENIDLMVLDIMMPVLDGFQLIRKLGRTRNFPIIFLSARTKVEDKILGLNLGADDYMDKPFDPSELVARVMAVLRRRPEPKKEEKTQVKNGSLVLDRENRQIYQNGQRLDLTAKEYLLLKKFLEKPGKVFTKEEIYEDIWEEAYVYADNTIMVHISKLREKIERDPRNPQIIKTIRGIGYTMVKEEKNE